MRILHSKTTFSVNFRTLMRTNFYPKCRYRGLKSHLFVRQNASANVYEKEHPHIITIPFLTFHEQEVQYFILVTSYYITVDTFQHLSISAGHH